MRVELSEGDRSAFEAEVRRVVERDAAGWGLSFRWLEEGHHTVVQVNLEHSLSPGFGLFLKREQVQGLDTSVLEKMMAREPDFEHIALAPACEHLDVVRGIRLIAADFHWREVEVRTVAGILVDAGCLADEEYEWLARYAGREHRRGAMLQRNMFGRVDSKPDRPVPPPPT